MRTAILGIDAAWTAKGSSGIALLVADGGRPRIVAAESSYRAFLERLGERAPAREACEPLTLDVAATLTACERFAGVAVTVAAIDMPLSLDPIVRRRRADDDISREYGSRKATAHSANPNRPGKVGSEMTTAFEAAGFRLATTDPATHAAPAFLEAFPHAAIIELRGLSERAKYKVGRSGKHWRGASRETRIAKLLEEWRGIYEALAGEIELGGHARVPAPESVTTLSALKRDEDALDAIVCAWTGWRFLGGVESIIAYGDERAAIWVPKRRNHPTISITK